MSAHQATPTEEQSTGVPQSTVLVTVIAVGLVVFGVLRGLWDRATSGPTETAVPGESGHGALGFLPGLGAIVPSIAVALLVVGAVGLGILFRGLTQRAG